MLSSLGVVSHVITKAKGKDNIFPTDMSEVEPFVVYSWLLTESQQKKAKAWCENILASCGIMVQSGTSASAEAEPSGHKAKKAKTSHTEAFVDGLFA